MMNHDNRMSRLLRLVGVISFLTRSVSCCENSTNFSKGLVTCLRSLGCADRDDRQKVIHSFFENCLVRVTDELELSRNETNEQKQRTRRQKGPQCETGGGKLINLLTFVGFIVGLIIGMIMKPNLRS